ncbi:hypothetical protein CASFOL_018511 [Castilleja foliolosa]|uniref:Transcription factor MYC/MYB N-terminal domain-containing protein n=1 Tax=Castilleja foliolosa TaxID=1961234 RepID=A0ABD3D5S2_9LAMI
MLAAQDIGWEDGFCNFAASTAETINGGGESTGYANSSCDQFQHFNSNQGLQPELFFKMSHEIYNYGEGLIGKVAADHSHKWIHKEPNDQEINFLSAWHKSADTTQNLGSSISVWYKEKKEDLRRVMDLVSVKEQHARTLLIHYRWDVEKLIAVYIERAKLLKKPDQCRAVYACSHLLWLDDQDAIKDGEKVLHCLKRSLRIANAARQMANVNRGSSCCFSGEGGAS